MNILRACTFETGVANTLLRIAECVGAVAMGKPPLSHYDTAPVTPPLEPLAEPTTSEVRPT